MKPKAYELLDRCIEDGLERGWRIAHKHTLKPEPEYIHQCQHDAVMLEICEWFTFDDPSEVH